MKKLFSVILIATAITLCTNAFAQRPGYRDETEKMLMRYKSGRLSVGGCKLSDLEVKNLIGEQVYYETYVGARRQRKVGTWLASFGAAITVGGTVLKSHGISWDDPAYYYSGLAVDAVGMAMLGGGIAYLCIGRGRLKWAASDYNERNVYGRDRSISLEFGPTSSGVGLSLRF
ncbi:MAG: hypothetical protein PUA96_07930 [Bacteroidales bacterium]|nr:hypothetical protein [Bacteroidales bacterium]